MTINPKNPEIFEVCHGEQRLRVRCHFLDELSRDEVISQTKKKAEEVLQILAVIAEQVRNEHTNSMSPNTRYSVREFAMIDAQEPILYLSVPDASDHIEVHVNLNEHLQYESSELIIP